jgi:hypothetical protein
MQRVDVDREEDAERNDEEFRPLGIVRLTSWEWASG